MIKKVDHIGLAVKNLADATAVYEKLLGVKASAPETVPAQGVRASFVNVGGDEIELLEPTGPETNVAKSIEKRGEGVHHICFEVDDIDKELKALAARGVELIDKVARPGLAGMVAFVHPKSTKGVLIELAQKVKK